MLGSFGGAGTLGSGMGWRTGPRCGEPYVNSAFSDQATVPPTVGEESWGPQKGTQTKPLEV